MPGDGDETFGLDQVLGAIHRDLKSAQKAAETDPFGLYVQNVVVELVFTVERSREGGGGINLKVLGIGAEAGGRRRSSEATEHRIVLTLSPQGWSLVAEEEKNVAEVAKGRGPTRPAPVTRAERASSRNDGGPTSLKQRMIAEVERAERAKPGRGRVAMKSSSLSRRGREPPELSPPAERDANKAVTRKPPLGKRTAKVAPVRVEKAREP
jgi:hypothetical protein